MTLRFDLMDLSKVPPPDSVRVLDFDTAFSSTTIPHSVPKLIVNLKRRPHQPVTLIF